MYLNLKLAEETNSLLNSAKEKLFSEFQFIAKGTIISKSLDMLNYDEVNWENFIPCKGKLIASEPRRLNLTANTCQILQTLCDSYHLTKTEAVHAILSAAISNKENFGKNRKKLRVLSLNVNDFGGFESLEEYKKKKSYFAWDQMDKSMQVKKIFNFICEKDPEVVVLQEYDEHGREGKVFSQWMCEKYFCVPHSWHKRSSITVMFVKRGIQYSVRENPHHKDLRASLISIPLSSMDLCIYGVHVPYDMQFWDELIRSYGHLSQKEEVLIIGDLNVYEEGTNRKEKYHELLQKGAIDLWRDEGYPDCIPTYGKSRLDYAIASPKLKQVVKDVTINSELLYKEYTDHAALIVDICCP